MLPCPFVGTSVGILADATKIFRSIHTIRDCITLQYDINKFMAWGKKRGLKFNNSKCSIISLISSIPRFIYQYKMGDKLLNRLENIIDLGININNKVKWNTHINALFIFVL